MHSMNPTEVPQTVPEFTPPKEGWLKKAQDEAVWMEEENSKRKNLEYGFVILDRDTAIAFIANFHAAVIANYAESQEKTLHPGEVEKGVVSYLERPVNEILRGEEHVSIHDLYDLGVEKKDENYEIAILRTGLTIQEVEAAFRRALQEELIDLDLIKEWDPVNLYEKLEARKTAR